MPELEPGRDPITGQSGQPAEQPHLPSLADHIVMSPQGLVAKRQVGPSPKPAWASLLESPSKAAMATYQAQPTSPAPLPALGRTQAGNILSSFVTRSPISPSAVSPVAAPSGKPAAVSSPAAPVGATLRAVPAAPSALASRAAQPAPLQPAPVQPPPLQPAPVQPPPLQPAPVQPPPLQPAPTQLARPHPGLPQPAASQAAAPQPSGARQAAPRPAAPQPVALQAVAAQAVAARAVAHQPAPAGGPATGRPFGGVPASSVAARAPGGPGAGTPGQTTRPQDGARSPHAAKQAVPGGRASAAPAGAVDPASSTTERAATAASAARALSSLAGARAPSQAPNNDESTPKQPVSGGAVAPATTGDGQSALPDPYDPHKDDILPKTKSRGFLSFRLR